MQKSYLLQIALLLSATLVGCASEVRTNQVVLTYESRPEGAVIFEGGQSLGVAPVTRTYTGDGKSENVTTPDVTAVWPSGAKATFWTELKVGSDRVATIERPANAPNLKVDLDNAQKFIAQKQHEAERNKDSLSRDISRDSARCRDQMAKGNVATNDCR